MELEIELIERYHWSLYDLDRTATESLLPYILQVSRGRPAAASKRLAYCDEVDFL